MVAIYDIYTNIGDEKFYENEIAATPANTMVMGNPMPATNNSTGSEPLVPAKKCKKAKCKKEKIDNKLDESSILGDIEDTIQVGDDVVEFARWLLNSVIYGFELTGAKCHTADIEDVLSKMSTCILSPSKGVYVIDTNRMFDAGMSENWDRLHITEKSLKELPKKVKTIKIYNFKYGQYQLSCYTHDISKINIEVYSDEGRSYGNLQVTFWSKIKNKNVKLGKITCSNFKVGTYSSKIESILLAKDSIMIEIDLSENENLTDIYGRFDNAISVKLPRQVVARQLANMGFIPHGCELRIYG